MHKSLFYLDSFESGLRQFPVSLHVSLTDHCPCHCYMCGHHKLKVKQEMDYTSWVQFLGAAPKQHLQSVCYTGGDPVTYTHLRELLDYHEWLKIPYAFATTGIDPFQRMTESQAAKAAWFTFSLDSIDEQQFRMIRGCHLEEVIAGIDSVYALGMPCKFNVVNTSQEEIIKARAFIEERWPNRKKVMSNTINQRWPDAYLELPKKCWASRYQHFIDSRGDVYPCCITAGDTRDMAYMEPLCNILDYDWWYDISCWEESAQGLPSICWKCHPRLAEINQQVNVNIGCKRFF